MKFLDETGLSYFLDKLKTFIKGKYVGINDPITISGEASTSIDSNKINIIDGDNSYNDSVSIKPAEIIVGHTSSGNLRGTYITPYNISIEGTRLNYEGLNIRNENKYADVKNNVEVTYDYIRLITADASLLNEDHTEITKKSITTSKFIKNHGTSSEFLMADGSVAEFNTANGVPKLNASGKIDSSQVDALTNAEIDAIVI